MKVDNAIILAAGTASRFAPISFEKPKALIEVRGEVLIERQIRQLKDAGIKNIIIVTGYKAEQFNYLAEKYDVNLIYNPDYRTRNNNSSIYAARRFLKNTYICSSDNYFKANPFENEVDDSYYSSVFIKGKTNEWCIKENNGIISDVVIGGADSWIMLGHAFWSEEFSKKYISILEAEENNKETEDKLWKTVYIEHIEELPMHIRKYPSDFIFEFDTLDELRLFDFSYRENSKSVVLKNISSKLGIHEKDIVNIKHLKMLIMKLRDSILIQIKNISILI